MTGSNHPRFRILIGWCCLMSAAILIMTVFLATRNSFNKLNTNTTDKDSKKGLHSSATKTAPPYNDKQSGLPPGQSLRNYIRLIWDDQKSWICSHPCKNSSLSLKNNTIEIAVSGFYFINAQVNFIKQIDKSKANQGTVTQTDKSKANQGTVTLLRNEGNGKSQRMLSQATRYQLGSVSINRIVHLMTNDSISLTIDQRSMMLSTEDRDTYWEIISL